MAEGHGLRRLEMREARHDGRGVFLGAGEQRNLKSSELFVEVVDGVADIEFEIERHLIVARTRRVKPSRRRADQVGKPRFDIHVDVFKLALEGETAALDFGQHRVEARDNPVRIGP